MKKNRRSQQDGFSLIEVLIVVGIALVLFSFAVIGWQSANKTFVSNAAMSTVVGQLRTARQMAISKRRNVWVWFDPTIAAPNNTQSVSYQIQAVTNEGAFPVVTALLPNSTQYALTGAPDTPMLFGNCAAVCFGNANVASAIGGAPSGVFTSTGGFINIANAPLDGSIFLGTPGQPGTARAVTILGATGRVRAYNWNGTQWFE